MSARTAARSPLRTAWMSGGEPAPVRAVFARSNAITTHRGAETWRRIPRLSVPWCLGVSRFSVHTAELLLHARQRLDGQPSGAVAERFGRYSGAIEHAQEQIRHW